MGPGGGHDNEGGVCQLSGVSQQVVGHPIRKMFLGYGDDAIRRTLELMASIIKTSSVNYYVRRWAEKIIQGVPERDDIGRVQVLSNYIRGNSRYVRDPQGTEFIKTPLVSLQLFEVGEIPSLDCDDYSVLSLSLLKSIGFPVALRATSYRSDGKFRHVYGLVRVKGQWLPLDLCRDYGIGWEADGSTKNMDYEIG